MEFQIFTTDVKPKLRDVAIYNKKPIYMIDIAIIENYLEL